MTRWYRAYVGTVSDPKLGGVALRADVSKAVAIAAWHVILESAADANAGGETHIDEFAISAAIGESVEEIRRILSCLEAADMFRSGSVVAWQRRQFDSDNSAERTRKWRERNGTNKEKKRPCDVTVTDDSVSVSVSSKKEEEENFDEFWRIKPKRKGANPKATAFKAFISAIKNGAKPGQIVESARVWATECADKVGTEFVPMAVTWLRQHRFDDYKPPPPPTPEQVAEFNRLGAKHGKIYDEKSQTFVKIGSAP